MGRVTTEVLVENLDDISSVAKGEILADQVRRVLIPDALIDTVAYSISLPTSIIAALGLRRLGERRVLSTAGPRIAANYHPVRLTIQGRDCCLEVIEVPDGVPALIGQVPLELLDFVVDPKNQRIIANPAHNGEYLLDMF